MHRIMVDFNTLHQGRVWISPHALTEMGIADAIVGGMTVIVYEPNEFELRGVIEARDEQGLGWWALVDWSTRHDLADC